MFEPEMAQARLVWAQCCVLTTVLDDYFDGGIPIQELQTFLQAVRMWDPGRVSELPDRVHDSERHRQGGLTETSLTISNTT